MKIINLDIFYIIERRIERYFVLERKENNFVL